jgi:hypothetical protein
MSERPEQLVLPLAEEQNLSDAPERFGSWHEWITSLPLGPASEPPDDAEAERRIAA